MLFGLRPELDEVGARQAINFSAIARMVPKTLLKQSEALGHAILGETTGVPNGGVLEQRLAREWRNWDSWSEPKGLGLGEMPKGFPLVVRHDAKLHRGQASHRESYGPGKIIGVVGSGQLAEKAGRQVECR